MALTEATATPNRRTPRSLGPNTERGQGLRRAEQKHDPSEGVQAADDEARVLREEG